jgi:hypothetical protein
MTRGLWLLIVAIAVGTQARATTIIMLNPSGTQLTEPGQLVGWGFEAWDDTYYLVPVASDFCLSFNTITDALPCQSPPYDANPVPGGTYTDYITNSPFVFFVSAPGVPDTSQENFSVGATGIGQFVVNNDPTLVGQTLSGVIVLDYNLFTCNPNDPTTCPDPSAAEVINPANSSYDFFVTAPTQILVTPEPATFGLVGAAFLLGRTVRRRAGRKRQSGCPAPGKRELRRAPPAIGDAHAPRMTTPTRQQIDEAMFG